MLDLLLCLLVFLVSGYLVIGLLRRWALPLTPFFAIAGVLIVVGLLTQSAASPFFLGLSDGSYYLSWGRDISGAWQQGEAWNLRPIWPGKGIWPLAIAVFTYFFGELFFFFIVLNSLLVGFSAVALQRATDLLFSFKARWSLVAAILTSPAILLWGPTFFRESIFWFGICSFLLAFAYLRIGKISVSVAFLAVSTTTLLLIRPNLGIVLVSLFITTWLAYWAIAGTGNAKTRLLVGLLGLLVVWASFPGAFKVLAGGENPAETVAVVSEWISVSATTGIKVAETDQVDELGEEVGSILCERSQFLENTCQAISRFPNVFFGPFPSERGPEPVWIFSTLASLHYLALFGVAALGAVRVRRKELSGVTLVLISIATMLLYASVMTNYGILSRFRVVSELIVLPIFLAQLGHATSSGLSRWRGTRKK